MDTYHELALPAIAEYRQWLTEQEKSRNTVGKYIRDVTAFFIFLSGDGPKALVSKSRVIEYKEALQASYKVSSINSMLVAVNGFLQYTHCEDCCVKLLKCQRSIFRDESRELTKSEYVQLLNTARRRHNERLRLLLETICSTGIRVSELRYITVEAANRGRAEIDCKGKRRSVFIPKDLCRELLRYVRRAKIDSGVIFITKSGKPMDRSNIWHDMKTLCSESGVAPTKVFPHNLRHLFARTFYGIEKDIVRLADILGHSSVDTTRIYTISSGAEHALKIERLGLVV